VVGVFAKIARAQGVAAEILAGPQRVKVLINYVHIFLNETMVSPPGASFHFLPDHVVVPKSDDVSVSCMHL
jgi:hypothetical protein